MRTHIFTKQSAPFSLRMGGVWIALLFILASCSSPSGPFRLEGQFKNMNQAEFYLLHLEKGTKDTIHVNNGRFTYETLLNDTVTLTLLFPNYSELPIFAQPGITVKMKGDASHLRETDVKGSPENKAMTDFRMHINNLTPPEVKEAARQFISEHPASNVSLYLLQRFFLSDEQPDYAEAFSLCEAIGKENTSHNAMRLREQLNILKNAATGTQMPSFSAIATDKKPVSNKLLQAPVNVLCFWASWNTESQAIMREIRKMQTAHPGKISVISISLDASPDEGKRSLTRDSITWPNVCDGKMWQTPLALQLGVGRLPTCIIANDKGNILSRSADTAAKLKAEMEKLLKP